MVIETPTAMPAKDATGSAASASAGTKLRRKWRVRMNFLSVRWQNAPAAILRKRLPLWPLSLLAKR
jgi:hypothetical protein